MLAMDKNYSLNVGRYDTTLNYMQKPFFAIEQEIFWLVVDDCLSGGLIQPSPNDQDLVGRSGWRSAK